MSDYRDNMTLDEIAANDLEMTKEAIKNANKYSFNDPKKAVQFIGVCIKNTLKHLGIKNFEKMNYNMLKRVQKTNKIKIEKRMHYKGDDEWRCGIYIYKAGELVAFISDVLKPYQSPILLHPVKKECYVITNARVDLTQRIFT